MRNKREPGDWSCCSGKCHTFSLESILSDGFDESSIPISNGRFTATIMKLKFKTCTNLFQGLESTQRDVFT